MITRTRRPASTAGHLLLRATTETSLVVLAHHGNTTTTVAGDLHQTGATILLSQLLAILLGPMSPLDHLQTLAISMTAAQIGDPFLRLNVTKDIPRLVGPAVL